MPTTLSDPGKLMRAKFAGDCAECRGSILPGQEIYHSRLNGDRHRQCVEPGPEPAAPRATPPAADRRDAARAPRRDDDRRLWSEETDRRWAEGPAENAATPRARDATAAGPAAPDAHRLTPDASPSDAYVAPARATEFGRAGDRDAARRELAELIKLQIDFLNGLLRILA